MRFKEFKLINETVEAMQAINRMSQQIVEYFNQHPELVKAGTRIPLNKIITGGAKEPALDVTIQAVEIVIEPLKKFELDSNGRWVNKTPKGQYQSQFVNPNEIDPLTKGPRTMSSSGADQLTRGDVYWNKKGIPQDSIPFHVSQGHKTTITLPAEILTRSFETVRTPNDNRYQKPSVAQNYTNEYARTILSTVVHEFNHAYNSFQGMDFETYRSKVEKNKSIADRQKDIGNLLANADDEAFLSKNISIIKDAPQPVKDLYFASRELMYARKNFQMYERGVVDYDERIAKYEARMAAGTDPDANQEGLNKLKADQAQIKQYVEETRKDIKQLQGQQKQLKQQVSRIKPDPNLPTEYKNDGYWSNPVEVNSRLQQASLDMAKEIKSGISNQAITELIMKSFGDHMITVEYIEPDLMRTFFKPGVTIADREFKQLFQSPETWEKLSPQFKQEAFKSALSKPEFKRLVTIAYKFVQAEIANPASLAKTSEATLGQKLKAALIGIPQSEINNTILPSAKDAMASGARQAVTPGSPLRQNLVAATVEASKKLDTPGALKALSVGGKVLIAAGVAAEIYKGLDQIKALPENMPDEEYTQSVQVIVDKLILEFGLVYVAALVGAWASGVVLTALLPGLGTVAGAVVGFIAGGAAGYLALEFAGDSVASLTEFIVKELRPIKQPKLTGKQGAANARNALRNVDTPGNPSPYLHPELYPQNESLARILELAVVKKPT